jgi:hypothetical protein
LSVGLRVLLRAGCGCCLAFMLAGCAGTRVVIVPPPDECPTDADVERLARELVVHTDTAEAIEQDAMVGRWLDAASLCRVARGEVEP